MSYIVTLYYVQFSYHKNSEKNKVHLRYSFDTNSWMKQFQGNKIVFCAFVIIMALFYII